MRIPLPQEEVQADPDQEIFAKNEAAEDERQECRDLEKQGVPDNENGTLTIDLAQAIG